jgi:hypothetical protein
MGSSDAYVIPRIFVQVLAPVRNGSRRVGKTPAVGADLGISRHAGAVVCG